MPLPLVYSPLSARDSLARPRGGALGVARARQLPKKKKLPYLGRAHERHRCTGTGNRHDAVPTKPPKWYAAHGRWRRSGGLACESAPRSRAQRFSP